MDNFGFLIISIRFDSNFNIHFDLKRYSYYFSYDIIFYFYIVLGIEQHSEIIDSTLVNQVSTDLF